MELTERQKAGWLEVGRVINGTARKTESWMA